VTDIARLDFLVPRGRDTWTSGWITVWSGGLSGGDAICSLSLRRPSAGVGSTSTPRGLGRILALSHLTVFVGHGWGMDCPVRVPREYLL